MKESLEKVGITGALMVWHSERAGGQLTAVDGHLRKSLDPDVAWPCLITDLTDAEADYKLMTHDPIAAMAGVSYEALAALRANVEVGNGAIAKMLDDVARQNELYGKEYSGPTGASSNMTILQNQENAAGKWVRCEIGMVMTMISQDLHTRLWNVVGRADSQRDEITIILEAGLENRDSGRKLEVANKV
jgi:hypothetical protein